MNQDIKQLAEAYAIKVSDNCEPDNHDESDCMCHLFEAAFIAGYTSSLERGLRWKDAINEPPEMDEHEMTEEVLLGVIAADDVPFVKAARYHRGSWFFSDDETRIPTEFQIKKWSPMQDFPDDESAPSDTFSREAKETAIEFLKHIMAYEHESGNSVCNDERNAEELFEIFKLTITY